MDDDQNTAKLNERDRARGFARPTAAANIAKLERYLADKNTPPEKRALYTAQLAEFKKIGKG